MLSDEPFDMIEMNPFFMVDLEVCRFLNIRI